MPDGVAADAWESSGEDSSGLEFEGEEEYEIVMRTLSQEEGGAAESLRLSESSPVGMEATTARWARLLRLDLKFPRKQLPCRLAVPPTEPHPPTPGPLFRPISAPLLPARHPHSRESRLLLRTMYRPRPGLPTGLSLIFSRKSGTQTPAPSSRTSTNTPRTRSWTTESCSGT